MQRVAALEERLATTREVAMKRTLFSTVFVVWAGAVTFGNTLSYGFVWDDHFLIGRQLLRPPLERDPPDLRVSLLAGHADWKMYYRPSSTSPIWSSTTCGPPALGYHLTNVVTHLAVCLLVLWICSMLLATGS